MNILFTFTFDIEVSCRVENGLIFQIDFAHQMRIIKIGYGIKLIFIDKILQGEAVHLKYGAGEKFCIVKCF